MIKCNCTSMTAGGSDAVSVRREYHFVGVGLRRSWTRMKCKEQTATGETRRHAVCRLLIYGYGKKMSPGKQKGNKQTNTPQVHSMQTAIYSKVQVNQKRFSVNENTISFKVKYALHDLHTA